MTKLKMGKNPYIPNHDYHADTEFYSSSTVKMVLDDTMGFYKQYILKEPQPPLEGEALTFGSYLHSLVLEPEQTDEEFAVYLGNKVGDKWEQFQADNIGKEIIVRSQFNLAEELLKSLENARVLVGRKGYDKEEVPVSTFFDTGESEMTVCGELEGIKFKVRADYYKDKEHWDAASINDLKTTSVDVSNKKKCRSVIYKYGYHISAALYVDIMTKAFNRAHDFYLIFCNKRSLEWSVYRVSEELLEEGRKEIAKAIRIIKELQEGNLASLRDV